MEPMHTSVSFSVFKEVLVSILCSVEDGHNLWHCLLVAGWAVHERISHIEERWPYFIGFGLPLTFLASLSSSLVIRYSHVLVLGGTLPTLIFSALIPVLHLLSQC